VVDTYVTFSKSNNEDEYNDSSTEVGL